MSTSTARKSAAPRFVSAATLSPADELLGKLAAYRPIEVREVETKLGVSEATLTQVVVITEDGQPVDLGARPVFWQLVRRQLALATPEAPWVVGRLVQIGQAYRLDPLTDTDTELVASALSALPEHLS